MSTWSEPLLDAFVGGCWKLFWTADALYWVAKPRLIRDDQRRLHCESGPAFIADDGDAYFWRGTIVPDDWIVDRKSLTPKIALSWANIEQRRAACEILGWHRILSELHANSLDKHPDPQIGELVEVTIPDVGRERFLRVRCGTNREFALPVPPTVRTAIEAQAWTWGLDPNEFQQPEIRT